ncbi:MAG TPA: hypothetical protein ENG78_05320 [Acidiferrobacteraceae bacterium]|nr:hypothetical protein [Acidiferrobacteraceae bacterium]HEX20221.1 hypothetical protein [Acidiferrobacteraceae bacterium]
MRTIADRHLNAINRKNPTLSEAWVEARNFVIRYGVAISLGVISVTIYVLLYEYSGNIKHLAQEAYIGHKTWFFVPILIMFAFSLIHGSFTAHFWDSLGVKPKKP